MNARQLWYNDAAMSAGQADINVQPFLRWAGSKRQLVRRLKHFWRTDYTRYVEPFAGSSALFFSIKPRNALLCDKNRELIEVYEVLRRHPTRLHRCVTAIPKCRENYYTIRAREAKKLSQFQRAARFLYLNRFCFNGLYRTNRQGQFNVPFAPNGTGGFPSAEQFRACARVLRRVTLRAWDFGTTLRYTKRGDFVYLDPPYAVESRRVFREYGIRVFTQRDLRRLSQHLKSMHERGVAFLVSYADCCEAWQYLSEWKCRRVRVRRNIAGFDEARRHAYEILAWNEP